MTSDLPALLGKFTTASLSSLRYAAKDGMFVFLDNVYEDADLTKVDEKWHDCGKHRSRIR